MKFLLNWYNLFLIKNPLKKISLKLSQHIDIKDFLATPHNKIL